MKADTFSLTPAHVPAILLQLSLRGWSLVSRLAFRAPDEILERRERLSWLFLLASAWVLTTPYSGVWHDGNLYALQALHHLQATNYAKELFFAYGSQDDFTLFSLPYAFLIRHLGLGSASALLFCLCQALWLCGAIRLFRCLLPEKAAYLCILFLAATRHHYGGFSVFSYAESFVTARLAAEAIALWALAAAVEHRSVQALVLTACSLLMHPLIGIWVLLPTLLLTMRLRHAAILMAAGSGLLPLLMFVNIGPEKFVARFDAAWLWLLHDGQVPYLFLDTWTHKDIQQTLFATGSVALAALCSPPQIRHFWQRLVLLAIPAFTLTWALGSLLHSVLITQLQPWRILWVLQVLQWPALASCLTTQRERTLAVFFLAALVLSYISSRQDSEDWMGYLLLALAPGLPIILWNRQAGGQSDVQLRLRMACRICLIALTAGLVWHWLGRLHAYLFDTSVVKGFVFFNVLPPALAISLACGGLLTPRIRRTMLLVCAVIGMELGLLFFDARRPLEMQEMACTGAPDCRNAVRPLIPQGSMVYWEDDDGFSGAQSSWFFAETATYVSGFQSSSRAFSRQLALEDERRRRVINGLPPRQDAPSSKDAFAMDAAFARVDQHDIKRSLDLDGLRRVCQDPALDYIVASAHYAQYRPTQLQSFRTQYIYACPVVRRNTRASEVP